MERRDLTGKRPHGRQAEHGAEEPRRVFSVAANRVVAVSVKVDFRIASSALAGLIQITKQQPYAAHQMTVL